MNVPVYAYYITIVNMYQKKGDLKQVINKGYYYLLRGRMDLVRGLTRFTNKVKLNKNELGDKFSQ